MPKYKVALLGLGNRGMTHLHGFKANADRFELSAICSSSEQKLQAVKEQFGVAHTYTDPEKMFAEVKPDVFCFATPPSVRLSLIELAARHGVKAIAMEKPIANSLQEAKAIGRLCKENGIRVVVCHQQKYLPSFSKLHAIVNSGDIGQVEHIHAKTRGWLYNSGTHFVDYMLWINGGAKADWVIGHVHGKEKLTDSHPSPDYCFAELLFENRVRGTIECGYLSPAFLEPQKFWTDNRLTVHGTHGYVWAETDGRWGAFTRNSKGEVLGGQEQYWAPTVKESIQSAYTHDLADWLDDERKTHSCNLDISEHGYEILYAICSSAMDHKRVDLPLSGNIDMDIIAYMKQKLPTVPTFSAQNDF
ncbi:Gfo/Idh/MocA family protein [Paenibacillus agricola]|uniref:Gfo/Idh/MocA family oxidoreductase n=1 Tax=Paenibacillus agricola TaxID=2716264 RepID=A0ABX0JDJ8_9BACL|nr:Gfo/Idh/MocA family oxidoreductase [Paenibacillus agricola]NHN33633.1 Gfo/Idh/MocA family oxidoreductase [Paenibacillus agricola]